jgi:CheY-like chemotaxis protein
MARVLIIDDEEDIRVLLRMAFEESGFEVDEAGDGQEGLEIFRRQPPDLVVTDMVMPLKDGSETIAEIRQSLPDMKIIAISGGGQGLDSDEYLDEAEGYGADRVFDKPVNLLDVVDAACELLGIE